MVVSERVSNTQCIPKTIVRTSQTDPKIQWSNEMNVHHLATALVSQMEMMTLRGTFPDYFFKRCLRTLDRIRLVNDDEHI
jgi:hypothetical protein